MSSTREVVSAYWAAAAARDWEAFAALLADDVVYELPQTGERIRGRTAYVRFNTEYPGDWRVAAVERLLGDGSQAVSWVTLRIGQDELTGVTFFELDADHRVARIVDFWPEPYDPPPGREHLVERSYDPGAEAPSS